MSLAINTIKPNLTASKQSGTDAGVSVTYDSATTAYDAAIFYDGIFSRSGGKVAGMSISVIKPGVTSKTIR